MDSAYDYRSPPPKAEQRYGRSEDQYVPLDRRSTRGMRPRSRSPVPIDRYQPSDRLPRDDYYTSSRDHTSRDRDDRRRGPSPIPNIDRYVPGQETAKVIPQNPLPAPLSLDFQVGFNWFAEWWRMDQFIKEEKERQKHGGRRPQDRVKGERESREEKEKERSQIQAAYDLYKEELQIKMAKQFVQQHKSEEWFKERYVPEIRDAFRQRLTEFRRENYNIWERDLKNGLFDEFSLEGIYRNDSDGAGGVVEKEEGEATAVTETLGVGDLVPAKGADLRDESTQQPALLIKTLAPNVSRVKIEEFCKEHLGEQDGGFKWLSLSDPNPTKKYHRIGWILLHPNTQVTPNVERGDGREEEKEVEESEEHNETLSTSEKALEAINGKTIIDPERGDFTCHVGVHSPPNILRKKALWDLFSAPERIERDLELAKRIVHKLDQELGTSIDAVAKIEANVDDLRSRGLLQSSQAASVKPKKPKTELDLDQDVVLLEEGEEDEGQITFDDEVDDEDLLVKKKKLDLLVEYLRRVFNFCFFCVFESDSPHELVRKCPGGHLRRPRSGLSSSAKAAARASALGQPFPSRRREAGEEFIENGSVDALSPMEEKKFQRSTSKSEQQLLRAFNWVKTYEDKLFLILEPENADLKKIGGLPLEEGIDAELSKFVKQEDEGKFRCKIPECTKLFKAQHFWRKHVEKRHSEWFEDIKKDVELVNIYVMDPAHIAPSRSDANSNGHFPTNNHVPSGTPRGFNLSNIPFNLPNVQGNFQMAGGFPPFITQQVAAQGWQGNGMAMDGGLHQAGAVRRGGGRFSARTGPYDRRGRGFSNGRLSPSRGLRNGPMMNTTTARWLDGAGAQAVGPREAVQGRSLKSYEDLDAVGGNGAGELNY